MKISAISSYKYNNTFSSSVNKVASPSFKAGLGSFTTKRVLNMLKPKVSEIKICSNFGDIRPIMDEIIKSSEKNASTHSSVGIMVIPDNELKEFLGEKASNYDIINNRGICIAIGDKYAPIESWLKCYDAVLALIPREKLECGHCK